MNHRVTKLLARTDIDADATKIIDINVKDPISTIMLKFELLYGSVTQTAHRLACLTKIELVDGSDVIFSLNGREAAALDWYHNNGKFKGDYNYCCTSGTPQSYVGINFGRYLWDKELAIVPDNFTNLQLKLTFDIDAADASCAHNYITVWANLFDEQSITPTGFLTSKEIKDYTTGASAHEYTDLPTDHPYRALFLRCQLAGTEPSNLINNFKLAEDVDKRVIWDDQPSLVMKNLNPYFPEVREDWWFSMNTSNRYLFITPTERVKATASTWGETSIDKNYAFYDGDGGRLKTIVGTVGLNDQILTSGLLPHGVWQFPFGDPNAIAEWYDVAKVGSLLADVLATGSGGTATAQLFLQQYRKYS